MNNVLINTDHMKIHTGKKPHSCTECDKAFAYTSDLKRHMHIHTGDKPHPCSQCSKAFCSEKSSNRSYENTHWGEIPSMQPV